MKIIAVDDDQISLDLLHECLAEGGYEHVTLMTSPMDVLTTISETAIAYDCILLDVDMPGKDGIQLCAEIRAHPGYRSTPIIMITKHKDHNSVERAFANGATDYVTKPFEFFEVLARIRIARLLVQERQAAMDSYVAIQQGAVTTSGLATPKSSYRKNCGADACPSETTGEQIMSLSVFQNYVERATQTEDCEVSLTAVKVTHIDEIFENTTATEFVDFLHTVAVSISMELLPTNVFLTHAGNGLFLCAGINEGSRSVAEIERAIKHRLQSVTLPDVCSTQVPVGIVVGHPLTLKPTVKLNFNRASKAAIARMERRARPIIDTKIPSLVE